MAGFSSIDYFKQTFLRNGLAKPSRYRIEFGNVPDGGYSSRQDPIFPAETVTLPTRSFVTKEEQWFGPKRTVPVGNSYNTEVVVTFPVSSDQRERAFLEGWMSSIVPDHQAMNGSPEQHQYSNYIGSIHMSIKTLDELDKVTSTYTFQEVYPSNIYPISLGANMFNDYTRLQVSFQFRHYAFHMGEV